MASERGNVPHTCPPEKKWKHNWNYENKYIILHESPERLSTAPWSSHGEQWRAASMVWPTLTLQPAPFWGRTGAKPFTRDPGHWLQSAQSKFFLRFCNCLLRTSCNHLNVLEEKSWSNHCEKLAGILKKKLSKHSLHIGRRANYFDPLNKQSTKILKRKLREDFF